MTICDQDYSADIIERRWLSKKTFEIILNRPASFTFKPGQRISLKFKKMERDYSLASSPDESHLKLCIRHVKKGVLSQALGDTQIGTRISFAGPHGYFTYKDSQRPTVFIATGTGIAPFRSMVRSGTSPDFFLHGVETSEDLYYSEEFQSVAESYIPCLSQSKNSQTYFEGRVTDYLQMHLPPENYDFYLCGRNEMIRDATLLVDELFEGSNIYTETFY